MEFFSMAYTFVLQLIDIALHIDIYLKELVVTLDMWIYLVLFLVVFCETGLVVTPFLPGDSLLFAGGTLAGAGMLHYFPLVATLLAAAIIGDAVNFRIGRYVGPPIFYRDHRFLKRKHLQQAQGFYEYHGGKAIILARFIPIVRTFAPFVAGIAKMHQGRFTLFNVTGALIWVFSLVSAGYFLGNLKIVQENFSLLVYAIIAVSCLPVVIGWARIYVKDKKA